MTAIEKLIEKARDRLELDIYSPWERDFLSSAIEQFDRKGQLSAKQAAKVREIVLERWVQGRKPKLLAPTIQLPVAPQERFLLLDCSTSMGEFIDLAVQSVRKIDRLRDLVATLRAERGLVFRQIVFPCDRVNAAVQDDIPEPSGLTPLAAALRLAGDVGAKHIVVVSDGLPYPDSEADVFMVATSLGCPIDTFYVGPPRDLGEHFLRRLAALTGGQAATGDLRDGLKRLTDQIERALRMLPPAIELPEHL